MRDRFYNLKKENWEAYTQDPAISDITIHKLWMRSKKRKGTEGRIKASYADMHIDVVKACEYTLSKTDGHCMRSVQPLEKS